MNRLESEIKTVGLMIDMYCRHHHSSVEPCEVCRELFEYARHRSLKCPYGENKPVCSKCRIHCYKPQEKAKIKAVMQYSGPRMIRSHPLLALRHLIAARKKAPGPHPRS